MSRHASGEHFEALISSGRYASASDVLCDGLQLLEERERPRGSKLDALRADIREGSDSGPAEPLAMDAVKAVAREERQRSKHGA